MIVFYLKRVCNTGLASSLNKAFFKNERRILFHSVGSSFLFTDKVVDHDINLLDRLEFWPLELHVHLDYLSCLLGHHIVELPREVLRRETEILGEHHVAQDVLSVAPLDPVLVLSGQVLVYAAWLENYELKNVIVHFEKLTGVVVNQLHDSVSYFQGFVDVENLVTGFDRLQVLQGSELNVATHDAGSWIVYLYLLARNY